MKLSFIQNIIHKDAPTPTITFIIPTIGRATLERSLLSLKNQTSPHWNAIVVFDGIQPTITNNDPRIQFLTIEKKGNGWAGYVRNEGMKHVKTEWIGFLDDDDVLTPNYMAKFQIEARNNPDAIIFRMKYSNGAVLPPIHETTFKQDFVGISFCFQTRIFQKEGLEFKQSGIEDYEFLNTLREHNKRVVISQYITYLVRPM